MDESDIRCVDGSELHCHVMYVTGEILQQEDEVQAFVIYSITKTVLKNCSRL
jgi:glutaminase